MRAAWERVSRGDVGPARSTPSMAFSTPGSRSREWDGCFSPSAPSNASGGVRRRGRASAASRLGEGAESVTKKQFLAYLCSLGEEIAHDSSSPREGGSPHRDASGDPLSRSSSSSSDRDALLRL